MAELKFEIVEHLIKMGQPTDKGWQMELNRVSWNDREAKYDIRSWNEDHSKMGKGVTLTEEEFKALVTYSKG